MSARSRASRVDRMTDPRARGHTAAVPSIPGVPETILVAPDSFKGTMTAAEVARRDRRGPRKARPAGRPVPGRRRRRGDARGAACRRSSGELQAVDGQRSAGPRDRGVVRARRRCAGSDGRRSSRWPPPAGSALVPEDERDAFAASTFGTGELIAAAVEPGREVVYVGVGGSATTDGGAGAIQRASGRPAASGAASSSCCATCARRSRTRRGCSVRRRARARTTSRG